MERAGVKPAELDAPPRQRGRQPTLWRGDQLIPYLEEVADEAAALAGRCRELANETHRARGEEPTRVTSGKPHPLAEAHRAAFLAYMEATSTVGYDAAHRERDRYLDARNAWCRAGCPLLEGEGV